ncbi:MAG: glycosyltransferase [Lachnospiraceae bacterium]|nr:glycosyltransferase [Lachnospiraceae bacterium]
MNNNAGAKWVSVIVAAYNIEQYLSRCLDSLLAQTYGLLEIIVVDDGSTDGTPEICDRYARENENIKVIHRVNGGLSAARNSGLEIASGDFIGFVDGDDWVEPQMYAAMVEACAQAEAQIATCSYREVGEGAQIFETTGEHLELSMKEALELFVYGDERYHIYNSVWSKLFAREIVKDLRFVEGKSSEDIIYTTWALSKVSKCVLLDEPFYNYMIDRSDSIMNVRLEERRFKDEIPFWREQISYFQTLGFHELSEKAAYRFYRRLLNYYLDFRNRGMQTAARKLIKILKDERAEIARIYKNEFVPTGDRVRMGVALVSSSGYYRMNQLYDRFVIPLRQRIREL